MINQDVFFVKGDDHPPKESRKICRIISREMTGKVIHFALDQRKEVEE